MMRFLPALPIWSWMALLVLVALLLGFFSLRARKIRLGDELMFSGEFRTRFVEYANSRGRDGDAYQWLTLNSVKMQSQMGELGILSGFRDPPFQYRNYPAVLNMLPRIRRDYDDWNSVRNTDDLVKMFDEVLVRYMGNLTERHTSAVCEFASPLCWLRRGIEQLLAAPLYFFAAFGVVSAATVRGLQKSWVFKLCSSLAVLLGALASIVSLANDGNSAMTHLRSWLGF